MIFADITQTVQNGIVGIILVLVELSITTVAGLLIKKWFDKKQKDQKELEELREEKRVKEDNQRCESMKNAIHSEIQPLMQDVELMKKTMQRDTRRSLRQDAVFYIDRGGATHQEKTEYDELYWCYHNLGKNGVVDSDHQKVMDLPDNPPKGE